MYTPTKIKVTKKYVRRISRGKFIPEIRISAKWLNKNCGFSIGDQLEVTASKDLLIFKKSAL